MALLASAIFGTTVNGGTNSYGVIFKYDSLTTGVSQIAKLNNQISIFPNPASGEIHVISEQSTVISIDIYNMLGETVYTSPITNYQSPIIINIVNFPSGVYIVKVMTEKGIEVKRFVKE